MLQIEYENSKDATHIVYPKACSTRNNFKVENKVNWFLCERRIVPACVRSAVMYLGVWAWGKERERDRII